MIIIRVKFGLTHVVDCLGFDMTQDKRNPSTQIATFTRKYL